jgi:hypothetical protein
MSWICWALDHDWKRGIFKRHLIAQRDDTPKIIRATIEKANAKGGVSKEYRQCRRCGKEQVAGVFRWHDISK